MYDTYALKKSRIDHDAGNSIKIRIDATPRHIISNNARTLPAIDEKLFGVVSIARHEGIYLRISVTSKDLIKNAMIHKLSIEDSSGVRMPEDLQNQELVLSSDKKHNIFMNTNTGWYGTILYGTGTLHVSGHVTFEGQENNILFSAIIPIECLPMRSIITRKRWEKFISN